MLGGDILLRKEKMSLVLIQVSFTILQPGNLVVSGTNVVVALYRPIE